MVTKIRASNFHNFNNSTLYSRFAVSPKLDLSTDISLLRHLRGTLQRICIVQVQISFDTFVDRVKFTPLQKFLTVRLRHHPRQR